MSTQPEHHEDGNLPAALRQLGQAIHKLTDPTTAWINNQTTQAPSPYQQLQDATPGQQGTGHGPSRSIPPCWLDAIELLNEIDLAVEIMQPAYTGTPPTIGRLKWLLQRKWRPQDTHQIEQLATNIHTWATEIETLLNPEPQWTLPNPCPACQTAVIYRKDISGDLIRKPALTIGPNGCTCLNCKAQWGPAYFTHLARVLGYQMPTGVLE